MITSATSQCRKRRCRFTGAVWREYWIETRIVQPRVELHAVHLRSGHRYVAKAQGIDVAASELTALIERCPPPGLDRRRPSLFHAVWTDTRRAIDRIRSWASARRRRSARRD